MHSSNPFVAGLSLTTVGNLATPDIARDLMMEVEKHLRGGRPYLMKKVRRRRFHWMATTSGGVGRTCSFVIRYRMF